MPIDTIYDKDYAYSYSFSDDSLLSSTPYTYYLKVYSDYAGSSIFVDTTIVTEIEAPYDLKCGKDSLGMFCCNGNLGLITTLCTLRFIATSWVSR